MAEFSECTLDDVASALRYLNESDQDVWIRMGFAIKSEFGESGFDVWNDWSSGYAKYKEKEARTRWKSFKTYGSSSSVGIGTLFHEAMQRGWQFERSELTPEQKAQFAKEREARCLQREKEEAAEREATLRWHALIAAKAQEIWGLLKSSGKSPYLGKKKIKPYGAGFVPRGMVVHFDEAEEAVHIIVGKDNIDQFFADKTEETSFCYIKPGCLVVPLLDENWQICNLQIIYQTGKKSFLKHGRKSGLFFVIGSITEGVPLAFVEGFATGASVHMAIGWPVVIALDAGNLVVVAKLFRKKYQQLQFVIAGDNDLDTEGNPGKKKALQAANDVNGIAVLPQFDEVMNG